MAECRLREDLARAWGETRLFERVAALEGEVFRAVADRRTLRIQVAGRAYFAKIHSGSGWREIFKNLLTLRAPVVGARNEYRACLVLERAGVQAPTVAGFGERGLSPARRFSFVICDALEGRRSLEDVTAAWASQPPPPLAKRRLIQGVAELTRAMHRAGVVHRDFYICHLLLRTPVGPVEPPDLAVIDLHRAQIHPRIPRRWLRRDLAALLYSVLELPLSRRDWLRFLRTYRDRPLRQVLEDEGAFWRSVERRALALYRKGRRKGLVKGDYRGPR